MNHVLLVSDQPMPNFLPILNESIKPQTVTLVVSDRMRNRAEWLKAEITKHQVEVIPDICIGEDVSDILAIQNALLGWADANVELMSRSFLNVTGGTKPMAIAAQEVFRMADRPVFYVDVATDRVTWLHSGEGTKATEVLGKQPTLKQFFGLNGITLMESDFKSNLDNEKWRHFYAEIATNPKKWALAIRGLNRIAAEAFECNRLDFDVPQDILINSCWNEMSEILHADELVCYSNGGTCRERFCTPEARRFCNGIWLEHYVFEVLKSFGFDRNRALMNVKIVDARGNENELDAVVLHKNTCYVIEDKTRNMRRDGVADAAVYKLAQLSSQMGLRAKGILVSASGVRAADRERARAYGVEVFDWLPDLKACLKRIFAN